MPDSSGRAARARRSVAGSSAPARQGTRQAGRTRRRWRRTERRRRASWPRFRTCEGRKTRESPRRSRGRVPAGSCALLQAPQKRQDRRRKRKAGSPAGRAVRCGYGRSEPDSRDPARLGAINSRGRAFARPLDRTEGVNELRQIDGVVVKRHHRRIARRLRPQKDALRQLEIARPVPIDRFSRLRDIGRDRGPDRAGPA